MKRLTFARAWKLFNPKGDGEMTIVEESDGTFTVRDEYGCVLATRPSYEHALTTLTYLMTLVRTNDAAN